MTAERSRASPPTPMEVVGTPFLPPGRATTTANRARSLVRRVHAAMAPPPVQILEGTFGILDHRVLVAICDIGVPDALTRATTVDELARRLGADAPMLDRVLRYAASRGWVRVDRRGRVRPTRVTEFLRTGHPGGWRAWVDFAGSDEVVAAISAFEVPPSTVDGSGGFDAFDEANGAPFFEWMAGHPDRWEHFDGAMAAGGRLHGLALAAAIDWSGSTTVCDVGGGTGHLLATLLDLVPGLEGTVFDLAEVVGRAVAHPRLRAVAGDAFDAVPGGFDTYLLVNVLHDWGDEEAIGILTRVGEAASTAARVVVVDNDRRTVPQPDIATATDLLMAVLTAGGKERDSGAFAALAARAGLHHERSVRLASADLAHVFSVLPTAGDQPAAASRAGRICSTE